MRDWLNSLELIDKIGWTLVILQLTFIFIIEYELEILLYLLYIATKIN